MDDSAARNFWNRYMMADYYERQKMLLSVVIKPFSKSEMLSRLSEVDQQVRDTYILNSFMPYIEDLIGVMQEDINKLLEDIENESVQKDQGQVGREEAER